MTNSDAMKALESFVIENDDLLVLESRIGRFNIFDALGIARAEIRHSNFLAFLLDPAESHGQGQLFLKAILMDLLKKTAPESRPLSPIDLDGTDLRGVEVNREWKYIDILIRCQEPPFIVVIENKIGAKEGSDQLTRYKETVKQHYPKVKTLFVYLTVEENEPSDDAWDNYNYSDIHRVLTRVRNTYRKSIGDDVFVFLDHYLTLIETRFMNDEEIDKLCRQIYKNHRQALDLIRARAGNPRSAVLDEASDALGQDGLWEAFAQPTNAIHFVPKSWMGWLPDLSAKGDKSWVFIRLTTGESRLHCEMGMAPMKDPSKRKEINTRLLDEIHKFGFKRPKSKGVKNNLSRISTNECILEWDEGETPDPNAVREAVKRMLDILRPKLEQMAEVLKPLCQRLGSAK